MTLFLPIPDDSKSTVYGSKCFPIPDFAPVNYRVVFLLHGIVHRTSPNGGILRDCSQKRLQTSGLFPKHWDCSRILRDLSGIVHYRFLAGILQGFFQDCSRILRDCSGILQFCGMVKIQLDLSQFDPCLSSLGGGSVSRGS